MIRSLGDRVGKGMGSGRARGDIQGSALKTQHLSKGFTESYGVSQHTIRVVAAGRGDN